MTTDKLTRKSRILVFYTYCFSNCITICNIHINIFTGPSGAHGRPGDRGEPGRPGTYMIYFKTII